MALKTLSHMGALGVYLQKAQQILEPSLSLAHVTGLREKGEIQLVSVGTCSVAGGADSVPVPLALPCASLWDHTCPPLPSASVCSMH